MADAFDDVVIRPERESDRHETEEMTRRSFYNKYRPGCDEHMLVRALRTHRDFLPQYSRVAEADGRIAGVIMYFLCTLETENGSVTVPSFGPLCADHRYKNRGIGTKLLEATLPLVKVDGWPGVIIFGEPEYYPKHGFVRVGTLGLTDADGNTSDAFLAYECREGALRMPGARFRESSVTELVSDAAAENAETEYAPLMRAYRPCQWTYDNAREDKDGYRMEYAVKYPREFDRLFRDYVNELALYDGSLKNQSVDAMLAELREDVNKARYLIFSEGEIAGLFVCSVPGKDDEGDGCAAYLEEIYVLPGFRGRGIAKDIFLRFLRQQKGDTGFCVIRENRTAVRCWEGLLEKAGYTWEKMPGPEENLDFYRVRTGTVPENG